jgi:hypothetical protein
MTVWDYTLVVRVPIISGKVDQRVSAALTVTLTHLYPGV